MTKFQKAFCIVLSLCFFTVLAVVPGPFFLYENVFRQLPLYCFLEKKVSEASPYEDRETYQKIVEENGKYLDIKNQDKPQKENNIQPQTEQEKEPEKPEKTKETLAVPRPSIDLSPAKLADFDYLLGQFYIVDSSTQTSPEQLNAARFLKENLIISKKKSMPQILIYHSHSQETFSDSREGKEEDTIVGVGDYLAQIFEKKYGYGVIHVKEKFDMKSGQLDRSAAYDYAGKFLEDFLGKNPGIQVIIDLHRDGVDDSRHLVTEINGKPTAQILFYNGLSYTLAKGRLTYLPNPYIEENLAFSFQLEYQAARYYPDFYRGIYLAGYRYNQHFRPRSVLLEAGAQTNTVQEVKNAMEPFADILDKVLQ